MRTQAGARVRPVAWAELGLVEAPFSLSLLFTLLAKPTSDLRGGAVCGQTGRQQASHQEKPHCRCHDEGVCHANSNNKALKRLIHPEGAARPPTTWRPGHSISCRPLYPDRLRFARLLVGGIPDEYSALPLRWLLSTLAEVTCPICEAAPRTGAAHELSAGGLNRISLGCRTRLRSCCAKFAMRRRRAAD